LCVFPCRIEKSAPCYVCAEFASFPREWIPERSSPEIGPKLVSHLPDWVATLKRNGWQLSTGLGGNFKPKSAAL
jgi:hypothetical protein